MEDTLQATLNTKQKENDSLQDYTRRFKTAREVLESHIRGPTFLFKYIKIMKGCDKKT